MSQDRAEWLDEDKIGDEYPPEQPLGVDEYGTTAAEEGFDEPLDERIAREEPEVTRVEDEPVELVQPDEGAHTDVDQDEVASAAGHPEGGPITDDLVQEREGAVPAEEAAVHVVDEE